MRSATWKRTGKDPAYLRWIRTQPCVVCKIRNEYQLSRTEAAHTGTRGLSQKAPDIQAIGLCAWHHRVGPDSLHKLGRAFFKRHGIDRDALIRSLQAQYIVETVQA